LYERPSSLRPIRRTAPSRCRASVGPRHGA